MLLGEKYEIINNVPMTCYKGIGDAKFILVNTFTEFLAFHELLMKRKIVFCDTETTGFHYYNGDRIIGMSFGWLDTHFYLPVRHQPSLLEGEQPPQLDMDEIRPYLQEFFAQEDVSVVFHHLKFDEIFYLMDDIHIKCKKHDTLILWKLFNEEAPGNLETIATGWTDIMGRWNNGVVGKGASDYSKGLTKWRNDEAKARRAAFSKMITEMTKEARSELRFNGMKAVEVKAVLREEMKDHPNADISVNDIGYQYVPIPQMTVYAASDTFYTYKIFVHVLQNMRLEGKLKALYDNELAVSDMLRDLQMQGLRADKEYFERKTEEYTQRIADLEREIVTEMGVDPDSGFNLGSNDQLAEALVSMGVPLTETTETGKLKVDKKVLTKMGPQYPIISKILDLRALQKLKGTYFDSLLEKMGPGGVIHASFNQNVSTGRFSCVASWTPVVTRRGEVSIDDVLVGDEVFTHAGQWKPVLRTIIKGEAPMYTLDFSNGESITCTAYHGLLLDSGAWVPAGWLIDEYLETMGVRPEERGASPRVVPEPGNTYDSSDCEHGWDHLPECLRSLEGEHVHGGVEGPQVAKVLSVPEGGQALPMGEAGGGAPQMAGRLRGRTRLPDPHTQGQTALRTPYSMDGGAGRGFSAEGCTRTSHRRGQEEQLSRQSGPSDPQGSQGDPHEGNRDPRSAFVTSVTYQGSHLVYDIEVEDDHSYLACGVFSHNSSSPNFTNMPRGSEVRSGFLNWSDEYIYFFADYSQVEVRLLAHMSDEAILKAAYLGDKDIHLSTACSMFGYNYDEALVWLKDEDHEMHAEIDSHRTISKIINFSIAYGASGRGLSEQIPRPKELEGATQSQWIDHCESFITRYFDTHLEVKRFINRTQREVRDKGYLVNPFGRVRRLPHVNARRLTGREDLRWLEGRAMRQGPNFLIQSTAGDVFKTASVRVHKIFQGTKSKICNLVHDDINCFIHKDEFVDLVPKIKHAMEDFDFSVPLKVDMAYSTTNWHEKRHFGLEDTERIAAL